jgi:tetratricopeptide (TPR) repeat protein
MQQGRYARAADSFASAFAIQPTAELVQRRYRALGAAGDGDGARSVLAEWLEQHPDDLEVRQVLASSLMNAGRDAEAIAEFEAFLMRVPDSVPALNNLATLYLRAGDPRALELAERAYAGDPRYAPVGDTLGWILVQRGEHERGLKYLREAQSRDSRSPEIHYHIGATLSRMGRTQSAIKALERALRSPAGFPDREDAAALLERLRR